MPSIFSRSRTTSTPSGNGSTKNILASPPANGTDEFGRISSRGSGRGLSIVTSNTTGIVGASSKKDKKKAAKEAKEQQRLRTISSATSQYNDRLTLAQGSPVSVPDASFLPLSLERPRDELGNLIVHAQDYGYLSYQRHVILGLEQVSRLVDVVCGELGARGGITTPFIFSSMALDINPNAIKRLIDTFLATCTVSSGREKEEGERRWREEAKFAGMHDLGMFLRWGLARVVRVLGGTETRGLVNLEHYSQWKELEQALNYPPTHFSTFLTDLPPPLRSILLTVLSLMARLTANSATSGHTPPTLSPLFGPLIFGLGPAAMAFHHTYIYYLRAVGAMEHILLAFVRWQDSPRNGDHDSLLTANSSASTLGVPTRLKEWIKGYPAMLAANSGLNASTSSSRRPQARKGARTVRVISVRRNVRMYERDLVRTAAAWGEKRGYGGATDVNALPVSTSAGLASSKEWERICPNTLGASGSSTKLPPRYSEAYKKKMNMPSNCNPDTGASSLSSSLSSLQGLRSAPSSSSYTSTMSSSSSDGKDFLGVGLGELGKSREGEDRFKSLTDLKWGEFENMGFGGLGADGETDKKLQFDLTESARTERTVKRQTLSWNDFSTSGFSRTDAPLSATLQFSSPLTATITSWPQERAEIGKKLKKREKSLPAFGWDTEPIVGSEEVIEETFVDVFCDLVWGSGWGEGLPHIFGPSAPGQSPVLIEDRDCNWALVEFKSLQPSVKTSVPPSNNANSPDPRTATSLLLFEEFVPLEYREQLLAMHGAAGTRKRLPSIFSTTSSKSGKKGQWKQAPTLNGRPYVVGYVPRSPSYREVEFEGLLRNGGSTTKLISLSSSTVKGIEHDIPSRQASATPTRAGGISSPLYVPQSPSPAPAMTSPLSQSQSSQKGTALPPPPASEEMHSDSTLAHSAQSSTQKRNKFRLPVSPAAARKAGVTPAEYSSVDFETRLASFSDEDDVVDDAESDILEGGSSEVAKKRRADRLKAQEQRKKEIQERRLSRNPDDAWVDILVGTQDRRMAGQDAVLRDGKKRVIHDPEAASLEVAQVLSAVQNREFSPSDDEDDSRVLHHSQPYGDENDDVDEIETVPRREVGQVTRSERAESYADTFEYMTEPDAEPGYTNTDYGDDEEEEEEEESPNPVSQRRLGYFDLHPDRRPVSVNDEDPRTRAKMAYDSDEEDHVEDEGVYGAPEPAAPISPSQVPVRPLPTLPMKASPTPAVSQSRVLPDADTEQPTGNGAASTTSPKTPSKTAALIEMYRERERGGSSTNSSSPAPSRIPVRPGGAKHGDLPVPPREPTLSSTQDIDVETEFEPPKIALEDSGRASPARYVHGAPLHNVLEEEEEE